MGLALFGELPSLRRAAAQVAAHNGQRAAQLVASRVDLSAIGDPAEVNKGWFKHELNPDHQALMMATEPPVMNLKDARLAKGWTQVQVAHAAGVSAAVVSVAERRRIGVSPSLRAKIVAVFTRAGR